MIDLAEDVRKERIGKVERGEGAVWLWVKFDFTAKKTGHNQHNHMKGSKRTVKDNLSICHGPQPIIHDRLEHEVQI
jgi:hypothetical protein